MKPFVPLSFLERLREAAEKARREAGPRIVARFSAHVAATLGDEIVERIAEMGTRAQLESLRGVLTPDQFALVTELFDVIQMYALRASVVASSTATRVSFN